MLDQSIKEGSIIKILIEWESTSGLLFFNRKSSDSGFAKAKVIKQDIEKDATLVEILELPKVSSFLDRWGGPFIGWLPNRNIIEVIK